MGREGLEPSEAEATGFTVRTATNYGISSRKGGLTFNSQAVSYESFLNTSILRDYNKYLQLVWTLKYLSLRHIRTGEWALWDLNPGTFGYEPTAVTCSAKGPQVILFTTSLYIMYYNITSKFCQQIFLLFSSFFLLSSLITLTILPHITKFVNTFFLFFFNFLIFIILYYIR